MSPPIPAVDERARLRADGTLLLLMAFWGTTFLVVKGALAHGNPATFLTLRFSIGALTLTAVARGRMLVASTLRPGLLLGGVLFLSFTLQTVGLLTTTPARSAFLTGLFVVIIPVLGWLFFQRRPRITSWMGVVLAVLGMRSLTGADLGHGLSVGDGLTLGCALTYALHVLGTERFAPGADVVALVAVQLWVVTGLSALCLPWTGVRLDWTPAFLGAVAYCGLLASAGALCVQTWAQAHTSSVRVALLSSLEPVFTAVYSVALGLERLGAPEWLGGGLIVLGVLVAELGGHLLARSDASRHPAATKDG